MKKTIAVLVVVLSMLFGTVVSDAAADPNVVLVNPVSKSTVYSNNLLISVKISEPKTIKVAVYEEMQIVNGTYAAVNVNTLTTTGGTINTAGLANVVVAPPATFKSENNLSFYTKQVNGLAPGLYMIRIQTLDEAGEAVYSEDSYVTVKEKPAEEAKILETPQSGTMQFLQNLLKTIFGN